MPAPLSILIVLHDFALGGTERIAVRLANAWAAAGAQVTIFAGSAAGPLRGFADPAVKIATQSSPIARARGSRRRLARAAHSYAVTHRHDVAFVPGNFHWIVAAALGPTMPVVAQVSAALHKPQRTGLRQRLFERRMRRQLAPAAAVVALADEFRDQADAILGAVRTKTIALPALADDSPPPEPAPCDGPILAVGRLVPEKGFATLITAFARLNRPDARLVILGEGPDRARLEQLAERLGVAERVTLPGYVADTRPFLDKARLFVLSSQHEGYCAVLVEALAAGRAAVATDCTPATALLAGGAGAVVPIDDPAALAAAITEQLDRAAPDPQALAARVAHHRIGPVARTYLDLFERVRR